jgi:hypothetical protein
MEEQIIEIALNVIQPVMEGSMILAAEYAKACGRDCVTGMDVKYAMRYAAQNYVGKHTGTLFPELQNDDSDSDSDEDDIEVIEEDEENCFTRYSGDDETMNKVNEVYDNWEQWEPTNMIEKMLQDAVNKND